jgi:hypothetical protein
MIHQIDLVIHERSEQEVTVIDERGIAEKLQDGVQKQEYARLHQQAQEDRDPPP